jgi:hypothetical protein
VRGDTWNVRMARSDEEITMFLARQLRVKEKRQRQLTAQESQMRFA